MNGFVFQKLCDSSAATHGAFVLEKCNGGTLFSLEQGELAAALNSPHPSFVVSTPNGRVEALGTEFTVSVE